MDTSTPYSLFYAKESSYTSTYLAVLWSNKTVHSLNRCTRWCMWSTTLTWTWWNGISNNLSLPYLHRYTEKMEYHITGSLQSILCSYKMELLPQGADGTICNDHKPLARFLNEKNANNKVNRWGLEVATYIIAFQWISGAWNKAADCLSRLVELLHDRQATVQMLTATNNDGPTFNTRNRTAQCNITEEIIFCSFMTTLNDTFERELTQEDGRLWQWEQELKYSHSSQKSTTDIHFHKWEFIFQSYHTTYTAEQHPVHSPKDSESLALYATILVFSSSDEEIPVRTSDPHLQHPSTPNSSPLHGRAEPPSPVQHHMNYHHTSTLSTDDSFQDATAEEDFPKAPLDDTIWLDDPVPDRHLCIHELSQPHYQCSYPCPYRLDLLHSSPEDTPAPYYKMMDLSDSQIFKTWWQPPVMKTALIWKIFLWLNMDYSLHKHLYSLNSLQMN